MSLVTLSQGILAASGEEEPNPLLPHWSEIILVLIIFASCGS